VLKDYHRANHHIPAHEAATIFRESQFNSLDLIMTGFAAKLKRQIVEHLMPVAPMGYPRDT